LRQRLDRGQSCAYYPQESREKAPLSLDKFAFALADAPEGGAWKLLGHFETPSNPEKFVRWKSKKNSEENS
jgi:hypothetical protein